MRKNYGTGNKLRLKKKLFRKKQTENIYVEVIRMGKGKIWVRRMTFGTGGRKEREEWSERKYDPETRTFKFQGVKFYGGDFIPVGHIFILQKGKYDMYKYYERKKDMEEAKIK